jgi:hypothetical protein
MVLSRIQLTFLHSIDLRVYHYISRPNFLASPVLRDRLKIHSEGRESFSDVDLSLISQGAGTLFELIQNAFLLLFSDLKACRLVLS